MVHWDEHQIPFIKAETDDDLAVALGLVHAHLRLGQLEMMRRVAQGRVSEMIGALGIEIDRLMLTLDFARAVPLMAREIPPETRRWVEGFVRGLNHYIARTDVLPLEFELFGLRREPWSVADVLTLGRLASVDVTWIVWFQLLRRRRDADWPLVWRRLLEHDAASSPEDLAPSALLASALGATPRPGSNAFVVSAARTATGAPLIAGDPHLGLWLPNPWFIAGIASPSYRAVGLMIPGQPYVTLGRNAWIAWGGTSLHAASSDLVIVPADAQSAIREREQALGIRWGRRRKIRLRDSVWGPIVSDLAWLGWTGDALALRWMGHRPSDEITAMLRVNRARNWAEFQAALGAVAVPGMRMLYADAAGQLGQLMACHLPRRSKAAAIDLANAPSPEDGWDAIVTGTELPFSIDPAAGFIASANERVEAGDVPIGQHFSPPDRKRRLDELLSAATGLSVDAAAAILRDVHWREALAQRDILSSWLRALATSPQGAREASLIADLSAWNGDYGAESRGALAFELLSYHLARRLIGPRRRSAYGASWGMRGLIWSDMRAAAPDDRERALRQALRDAARAMPRDARWGTLHRLRLSHPLAFLPLLGRAYRIMDLPAAGTSETLMKTAHPLTDKRHASRYGSTARYISDLSDLDRNYFGLLGGQDGWLTSSTFADQVPLWRRGQSIMVPLRPETAAAAFPHCTTFTP